MKLSEILDRGQLHKQKLINEVPLLIPGKFISRSLESSFSPEAIKREFRQIGQVGRYSVYLDQSYSRGIAFDPSVLTDSGRHLPIFRINFKHQVDANPTVGTGKLCQVDLVTTHSHLQSESLASTVYKMLVVDAGIRLLSDSAQFEPGAKLWKKLARESSGYRVVVFDTEMGIVRMIYDGKSVEDSEVWTSGDDLRGESWLLLMVKC